MTTFLARLHTWLLACFVSSDRGDRAVHRDHNDHNDRSDHGDRGDRGQATTEYALVLLGAAMVALLLVAWATAGGGAGRIGSLLDRVLDAVTSRVG